MKQMLITAIIFFAAGNAMTFIGKPIGVIEIISLVLTIIAAITAFLAINKASEERTDFVDKISSTCTSLKKNIETIQAENQFQLAHMQTQIAAFNATIMSQAQALAFVAKKPDNSGSFGAQAWEFSDGATTKSYEPGRLLAVKDSERKTETTYEYNASDKTVTSLISIEGVLKYQTVSSEFGAPLKGCEYSPDGKVLAEYTYDDKGQLSERKKKS